MSLEKILTDFKEGKIDLDETIRKIRLLAVEEIEKKVRFDLSREIRRGVPEIIYAESKSIPVLMRIIKQVTKRIGRVIVSRLNDEQLNAIKSLAEEYDVKFSEIGRIASISTKEYIPTRYDGVVGIVTGGTADVAIAEEARFIVEEMGCKTIIMYDVGVAGLHRAINSVKKLIENNVDVVIVVAGMEGALPSLIASLIDVPVIGVPSSVGYGLGGNGYAALLSMLQACPLGVAVVNIDNGVNAGIIASLIARRIGIYRKYIKR